MKKFYVVQIYISMSELEQRNFRYIEAANGTLCWFTDDISLAKQFKSKNDISFFLSTFVPKDDHKIIKIEKYYSI